MTEAIVPELGRPLASVGQRVVARIIDGMIMLVVGLTVIGSMVARAVNGDGTLTNRAKFVGAMVGVALGALYEIGMVSRDGQTVGKKVMKIKIVSLSSGRTPDLESAVKRWLPNALSILGIAGEVLSTLVFLGSLVLVFTDPRRQSVNDKFAGTVVVVAE